MEIEDAGDTLVQTGPSVEDTSELKALVGQLSKTLEFLNMQEEQKRERQSTQQEDTFDKMQNRIFFQVWSNLLLKQDQYFIHLFPALLIILKISYQKAGLVTYLWKSQDQIIKIQPG